jgi:hypothetical protein
VLSGQPLGRAAAAPLLHSSPRRPTTLRGGAEGLEQPIFQLPLRRDCEKPHVPCAALTPRRCPRYAPRIAKPASHLGPLPPPSSYHQYSNSRRRRRSAASSQVNRLNKLLGVILGDSDRTGETIDIVEHLLGGEGESAEAERLLEALEPLQDLVATLSSASGTAASSEPPSPARAPRGSGSGNSGSGNGSHSSAAEDSGTSDASDASFHGGGPDLLGRRIHSRYPSNMCGGVAQAAIVPPPPPFDTIHCPMLGTRPVQKACNCVSAHNRVMCVLGDGGGCDEMVAEEFERARTSADNANRMANDSQRHRCYKKAFFILYGVGTRHERHPLPHCVVCAIRQAWPSDTGRYTGFKAN